MANFFLWLFMILISLLLLLLFIPLRYALQGRWEEKVSGSFKIAAGPLMMDMVRGDDGAKTRQFGFLWFRLKSKDPEGKKVKGKGEKKPTPEKKEDGLSFTEFLSLLNRDLAGQVIKSLKIIYRKYSPYVCEINGSVGFSDPYYTGLFAALCPFIPGQRVRADFSRNTPNLTFRAEGRITFYILVFQGIRLLLTREGREFMGRLIRIKKSKKNATKYPRQCIVQ